MIVGMGVSLLDIPGVKQLDEKVRSTIQSIIRRYAEFEQVSMQAPEALAEARRVYSGLRAMNASPAQIEQARAYLTAAEDTAAQVAKRGPIDQVIAWVRSVSGKESGSGLSAVPVLLPVWIAGTSVVALYLLTSTIKSWDQTRTVRAGLTAGLSPEQIAKLGIGRSPFQVGLFGATSAVTVLVAIGVAFFGYKLLKEK